MSFTIYCIVEASIILSAQFLFQEMDTNVGNLYVVIGFLVALIAFVAYRLVVKGRPSQNGSLDEASIPLLSRHEMVAPVDVCIQPLRLKRLSDIAWSNELSFMLNGATVKLVNPDPTELLATFIRDKAGLKGTKLGCEEGGCGACTVVLNDVHSVNSCLRFLCAVDGMSVTTVEGLGSLRKGLSDEQKGIVDKNGTQCGFCTPGWVTNMHALNQSVINGDRPPPSHQEIEHYFDGNICRCTGYKPILDAAFSVIPHKHDNECSGTCGGEGCTKSGLCAIEDLAKGSGHSTCAPLTSQARKKSTSLRSTRSITGNGSDSLVPLCFHRSNTNTWWYRPVCLDDLCAVLREYQSQSSEVQIMGGNTSVGVTKYLNKTAPYNSPDKYTVVVDVNAISDMTIKVSRNSALHSSFTIS
jgi:aerobic-type carbon monoxide dehydrogenase small subunit (CoxS/CutS family)